MPHTRSVYQRIRKYPICTVVLPVLFGFFIGCFPVAPPVTGSLEAPNLSCQGLVVIQDDIDGYHEALSLSWTTDYDDDAPVGSFSLLRKYSNDSVYELFQGSRNIPADTMHFYDRLTGYSFPESGYDSVYYRVVPLDTSGRAGDTSQVVSFVFAPQAVSQTLNLLTTCLSWESWIRGGVLSRCEIWYETDRDGWTSPQMEEFPHTDEPARFIACLPDSLTPLARGKWYYACFIKANVAQSLLIGSINVE